MFTKVFVGLLQKQVCLPVTVSSFNKVLIKVLITHIHSENVGFCLLYYNICTVLRMSHYITITIEHRAWKWPNLHELVEVARLS